MSSIPRLELRDFPSWAKRLRAPYQEKYLAMYSSIMGGIVTDPVLMVVPVDDHLVHRGDGVFETLKCVAGGIYNVDAHLRRLRTSAEHVRLTWAWSFEALTKRLVATVAAGGASDCLIRLLLSRGPGSLGVNPFECPRPGLYIVAAAPVPSFMALHPEGAKAKISKVPVKPGLLANVKSCYYLPNALMKIEAAEAGVDFVISLDENGYLAESAAEGIALVTADRRLLFPRHDRILPSTTAGRTGELAEALVRERTLSAVGLEALTPEDARRASEILILGTSPDVTSVVEFQGRPVGDGRPGPVAKRLAEALQHDMRYNDALRTPIIEEQKNL